MSITSQELKKIITAGETVKIEFKRCDGEISQSVYETVCSFSNRYGGDIFLGIDNKNKIYGVPEKAVNDIINNFVTTINNPKVFSPIVSLDFQPVELKYEDKSIIHIRISSSTEIHRYKKDIYDRIHESDIRVTSTNQIRAMCYRKEKYSTENIVYPHIKDSDLRLSMLKDIRQMAINHKLLKSDEAHPWKKMTNAELLRSAKLYVQDSETGKWGYNLAAVMLLGKDDLIGSIVPPFRTDAIMRKVNVDRYDDREMIITNLIDSYDLLMRFANKHLLDKFYLEDDRRVSLSTIIAREIIANILIHRELTSSITARFIIEKDKMFTENANRADTSGKITPRNFSPNSKNPIIASFFRNIGLADELGSGVRNLYHYVKRYSGKPPKIVEDDVFRTIIPLDDEYSYDVEMKKAFDKAIDGRRSKHTQSASKAPAEDNVCVVGDEVKTKILELMKQNPKISAKTLAEKTGIASRNIQNHISALKEMGLIKRIGKTSSGHWVIKQPKK